MNTFREHLQVVMGYNNWADRSVLQAAKRLPTSALHARQSMGFGTIFETLVHMMSSQRVWLLRWRGEPDPQPIPTSKYADLDQLEKDWKALHNDLRTFTLETLGEQPHLNISYKTLQGQAFEQPLILLFWHLMNHGVEHRTELNAMFTQAGHPPDRIDMIYYLRAVATRS